MPISVMTSKGQTTIPKTVRDSLRLRPKDKLLYIVEGNHAIVRPIHGSLRGLKGIFRGVVKGPIDFKKLREETKRIVARQVVEEMR